MGGIEPVEQPLVSRAAPAIVGGHEQHRKDAEPLKIIGEHHGKGEPRGPRSQPPGQAEPGGKGPDRPAGQLPGAVVPQQVQDHAADEVIHPAVGQIAPGGNERLAEHRHRFGQHRNRAQQRCRKGPEYHCRNHRDAPGTAVLAQPVDALPHKAEQHKIRKDAVAGPEPVRPAEVPQHEQHLDQSHGGGDAPDAQQIAPAVMGVGEAFRCAEEKQRRREPPRHGEPHRHRAGKLKHIMDMIQHHEHQGNGFEIGAGQPGAFVLQHGWFLLYDWVASSIRGNCVDLIRTGTKNPSPGGGMQRITCCSGWYR